MQKEWEGAIENKGAIGWWNADFWGVLEVAANKGVRGILEWAGEWWDVLRRTGGVALTTNALSPAKRLSRGIINEMVAVRAGC